MLGSLNFWVQEEAAPHNWAEWDHIKKKKSERQMCFRGIVSNKESLWICEGREESG